jgi:hypothetical protein
MDGIQVTTDYDQFKLLEANRDQNRGHIEALKAAFEEMGNLTRVQPILVNDQMEIIDGQHRFVATKELGESVYFTQVAGLGVHEARQMNILHRSWEFLDYAKSYANSGDASYRRFLDLVETYELPGGIILVYSKGSKVKGIFKDFRQGNFTLTPEELAQAKERLDMLSEMIEVAPALKSVAASNAVLNIITLPQYDHSRMLTRLQRNPQLVTRQAGVPEYMRVLEDVYNHNMAAENRVRLF